MGCAALSRLLRAVLEGVPLGKASSGLRNHAEVWGIDHCRLGEVSAEVSGWERLRSAGSRKSSGTWVCTDAFLKRDLQYLSD